MGQKYPQKEGIHPRLAFAQRLFAEAVTIVSTNPPIDSSSIIAESARLKTMRAARLETQNDITGLAPEMPRETISAVLVAANKRAGLGADYGLSNAVTAETAPAFRR